MMVGILPRVPLGGRRPLTTSNLWQQKTGGYDNYAAKTKAGEPAWSSRGRSRGRYLFLMREKPRKIFGPHEEGHEGTPRELPSPHEEGREATPRRHRGE